LQLTFKLKINLVFIGVKYKNTTDVSVQCKHNKQNQKCYVSYYKFQNYLNSLTNLKNIPQVVFLEYKTNYYLTTISANLTPILINEKFEQSILFQNQRVTKTDIYNILHNNPVHFDFTIVVYSAYSYIYKNSTNQLMNNTIGKHSGNTSFFLHVFLTPYLNNFCFSMSILTNLNNTNTVNLKNNISIAHLTEGEKLVLSDQSKSKTESVLNEEYCICQHPDTQFIPTIKYQQFAQLASKISQKYFLMENLGKFKKYITFILHKY
jgi:hypothetical protein